jgi:hypothetical protein
LSTKLNPLKINKTSCKTCRQNVVSKLWTHFFVFIDTTYKNQLNIKKYVRICDNFGRNSFIKCTPELLGAVSGHGQEEEEDGGSHPEERPRHA